MQHKYIHIYVYTIYIHTAQIYLLIATKLQVYIITIVMEWQLKAKLEVVIWLTAACIAVCFQNPMKSATLKCLPTHNYQKVIKVIFAFCAHYILYIAVEYIRNSTAASNGIMEKRCWLAIGQSTVQSLLQLTSYMLSYLFVCSCRLLIPAHYSLLNPQHPHIRTYTHIAMSLTVSPLCSSRPLFLWVWASFNYLIFMTCTCKFYSK